MFRYFLEVAYKGDRHAGFQIQKNATTIQGEINRSLETLLKHPVQTFGSSRTDAGVHAHQNFLHLDLEQSFPGDWIYKINAILPPQIVLQNIYPVDSNAHARFSALARTYQYVLYTRKNPFLKDFGYFYPYTLNWEKIELATSLLSEYNNFQSFSKRNTQVKTFQCAIQEAQWQREAGQFYFLITSDRFLRGMVRGLVATILKAGRGKITIDEFRQIIEKRQSGLADFSAPPQGLFLEKVHYPPKLLRSLGS